MKKNLLQSFFLSLLVPALIGKTNNLSAQTNGEWRTVASGRAFYNTRSDSQASWQIFNSTTQTWTNTQPSPGANDITTIRDAHSQTSNGNYTIGSLFIGEGGGALATANLTNDVVTSITITDAGSMLNIPGITFLGASTTAATASATSFKITGTALISVGGTTTGGTAYTTATVNIGTAWAPNIAYTTTTPAVQRTNNGNLYTLVTAGTSGSEGGPTGTGQMITDGTAVWNYTGPAATATATITNGSITGITITNPGSGYNAIPALSITGDGTGASYALKLGIETITITNGGSGYTTAPTIGIGSNWTVGNSTNNRTFITNGNVEFRKGAYYSGQNTNQTLTIGGNLIAANPISFRTQIGAATASNTNVNFNHATTLTHETTGAKMTFNNLTIAAGHTLTVNNEIVVLGTLTNNGTIDNKGSIIAPTTAGTGTYSGNIVLGVKLTSFTAKALSNSIKLDWTTSSEKNANKFVVEKSTDGKTFTSLTVVKSKGPSAYNTVDNNPVNGTNYYRLVQYDNDGTSKVYGPVMANFGVSSTTSLDIVPNPTTVADGISFSASGFNGNARVLLTNLQGRIIHTESINNITGGIYKLNLKKPLNSGSYILRLTTNKVGKSAKVIVL